MKDTYLSLRFCLFLTVLPASLSSQISSSSLLLSSSKRNENATDKTQTPAPFDTYWIKLLLLKHLKVHPVLNSIFVHLSSLSLSPLSLFIRDDDTQDKQDSLHHSLFFSRSFHFVYSLKSGFEFGLEFTLSPSFNFLFYLILIFMISLVILFQ